MSKDSGMEKVREEYVNGVEQDGVLTFPPLKQSCDRHGVAYTTARRRRDEEGWDTKRARFQALVEEESTHQLAQAIASRKSEVEYRGFQLGEKLMAAIDQSLEEEISKEGGPNYQALRQLSASAAIAMKMLQSVTGKASEQADDLIKADGQKKLDELLSAFRNMSGEERKLVIMTIQKAKRRDDGDVTLDIEGERMSDDD